MYIIKTNIIGNMVFLLMGRAGVGDGRVLLVGALERQNFELKCANNLSMSKSGNKKMKKLSSSSSTEAAFSTKGQRRRSI